MLSDPPLSLTLIRPQVLDILNDGAEAEGLLKRYNGRKVRDDMRETGM